jgi:hypothetical protein
MPYKFGKAILFSFVIWLVGFIWGMIIFMTPLVNLAPIPYISGNPAISFPAIIILLVASFLLAKSYLKGAEDKPLEGFKLGVTMFLVGIILDLLVIVLLFGSGWEYFTYLSIWLGYFLVSAVPYFVGRWMTAQQVAA